MVGTSGDGVVSAYRRDRRSVGKKNSLCLNLGFPLQLGVVLDYAFHGVKDAREALLQIVGQHKDFVGRFLDETPSQG
jgi:hypothetical protein